MVAADAAALAFLNYRPSLPEVRKRLTYAGQPLYLFDPGPASFFGADFFESVAPLPPWHTAWYLVGPDGRPATGPATLELESPTSQTTYTSPVIGAEMLPNAVPGGAAITVYSFSADSHQKSECYGACARDFIPVLTDRTPTTEVGVDAHDVGVIERSDGTHQVTYEGHPLYLFSQEKPAVGPGGPVTTGSVGNGNGIHAFGGTLAVVAP
jgi:predicted lipoprotein with Yx(FWY)xxD motif